MVTALTLVRVKAVTFVIRWIETAIFHTPIAMLSEDFRLHRADVALPVLATQHSAVYALRR